MFFSLIFYQALLFLWIKVILNKCWLCKYKCICFFILTGFFAVNRGPNKRQIKPAGNNSLLQLALGEDSEDSEEDADFELNDDDDDDEGAAQIKSTLSVDRSIDWLIFFDCFACIGIPSQEQSFLLFLTIYNTLKSIEMLILFSHCIRAGSH